MNGPESKKGSDAEFGSDPFLGLTHLNENGEASMVDVGGKNVTSRTAIAQCEIRMKPETLALIRGGKLKKGDAFTVAKIAGIQAAKKTADLIPLCHPLLIESIEIRFENLPAGGGIRVESEVHLSGKTGVEMEALTAVLISALTIYDMAKAYDPGMVIGEAKLIRKTGGKSDYGI